METLSNFASIYCFITFIMGAVIMLAMLSIAAMGKTKEPKVHFYIKRVNDGFELWLKDKRGFYRYVIYMKLGDDYIVDTKPFRDMKYDEIREVFINLED